MRVCMWVAAGHTHQLAMAARPAGANPPALKIKLKPRREPLPVSNAVSVVQQSSSGQQIAHQPPALSLHQKNEEDGKVRTIEGEVNRSGSFKRKLSSPSASPASKRFIREESPISESRIPLSAAGEPLEVFPGKSEQLSMDPHVVKQRLGQRHASIAALVHREQAVKLQGRPEEDEIRKFKSSALVLENLSHGQLQVISVVPSSQTVSSTDSSPGKQDDTGQMDNGLRSAVDVPVNYHVYALFGSRSQTQGSREDNVAIIPTHAGWFAWDRIHRMERQALPQFFIGKSKLQSPEIYLQVRNAIIEQYRQNPRRCLSLSDISGLNSLDDRELCRILEFLIHWGLVNYQAHPHLEKAGFKYPSKVPVYLDEDGAGALHILPVPLTPLECLYQYEALRAPVANLAATSVALDAEPVGMAEAVVKESQVPVQGLLSGNCCSVCSASCSQKYYYCEKQADYFLCSDCYSDGKFGIGMTVGEFALSDGSLDPMDNSDSGSWTDQETLMLLEALEIYGENWTEISEFVGTKSKAQCISHFIGLPIEDRFLDDMEVPRAFITEGRRSASQPSCSEDYTNGCGPRVVTGTDQPGQISDTKVSTSSRCPARLDDTTEDQGRFGKWGERSETEPLVAFAEAGNPVMALVAFLAAMVGPRVAAAAAHRALSSLSEDYHQASQAAADMRDHSLLVGSERVQNSCSGGNPEISNRSTAGAGIENHTGKSRSKEEKNPDILEGRENDSCVSTQSLKKATAAALAAAAVKAKLLADQEEREIQRLAAIIVDNQLKKLDVKLKQLSEIDPALEKECEQIERNRQRLSAERARFMGTRLVSTSLQSQMPVSTSSGSLNIRPSGSMPGAAVPATILTAAAAHNSGILRPTLFTIGPGGMAIPVSAGMVKPPS